MTQGLERVYISWGGRDLSFDRDVENALQVGGNHLSCPKALQWPQAKICICKTYTKKLITFHRHSLALSYRRSQKSFININTLSPKSPWS